MNQENLSPMLNALPADACTQRTYNKSQVVFEQGDPCGGLWIVKAGCVDLQRLTETGHLVLIHRAIEPQAFAEASLFSSHYHCTARASQAGTVLVEVERQAFLDALANDSDFAVKMCAALADQVQAYRRLVEVLSIRRAEDRVFAAAAQGLLDRDIKAFAARIALSHEVVYRALASLAEQGRIVKLSRGVYQVPAAPR